MIPKAYTYEEFKALVFDYATKQRSSGEQTEEHISATIINAQRIKRIDKVCVIDEELQSIVKSIKGKYNWTILVETWCGDGAQCIPVIAKLAALNPNIELKLLFRDENPEIMDQYLTNGSRSVPKLICTDLRNNTVIGVWGPRPTAIQNMVTEYKQLHPTVSHDEFVKNLHLWYARDKTAAIQADFKQLLEQCKLHTPTKNILSLSV